ncbi:MFS transporter [Haloarculaceae archaeon H-GB2-1]|nr:MFS transporter [Haloarculaceae archaeon H-GB1-1]MEA5385683.1 MFS transporter [Haloarculaceae archaeon H-GB11]MEA5407184.1 MFS transporter [Haloarculaceae archaeon H-GB2-1]
MTVENNRRALLTVFVIVFVDLLGFGILIPVIPLYARALGATEFVGSLLIASYSAMQFLAAPLLGRLSDERGRRPVLLLSLTGSVVAWTLFGVADLVAVGPLSVLAILFAARLLAGAMGGNIAAAQAYIADVTPPEKRAKGLGLLGAAFGLGFVFGPALGGIVSSEPVIAAVRTVTPAIVPVSEFTLPSFAAAIITAVNLVAAVVFLPESRSASERAAARRDETGAGRSRIGPLVDALRTPGLSVLVVAFFVASFAFSAMESQFIFFTNDLFDYGTAENAYLLTYLGIVVALVQGRLIGPLSDRFGEYRLAIVGSAIQVVTLAFVPFAPSFAWLIPDVGSPMLGLPVVPPGAVVLVADLTALAVGNALTNVSLNTLVSKSASDETQGGAFGLTQSAGSLARTFGPAVAGGLYTVVGFWAPFVLGGLSFLPVLALLGRLDRDTVQRVTSTRG